MPRVTINNIFGGEAPSRYLYGADQYLSSIGIDPDLSVSDAVGDKQTSGAIRPSGYAKFSGANVTGSPMWITTTPKTALVYAYMSDGKLVSYDSAMANEALLGTPTSGAGNGMAYYNNYLYLATPTNISRWGPLSGTAAMTNTYWTGTLSKTALVNTTYPTIRGAGTIPNHPMHVHVDGALYIGDFDSTSSTAANRGKGLIHKISTMFGTYEGDTDNSAVPSAYNALDLPLGYMPTAMASYGNDLVIAAIQTTNATLQQGKSALFFWDTVSDSFYNVVEVPDAVITAIKNINGYLYIFSGSISTGSGISNGYRVSVFSGGNTITQVHYSDVGASPLQGAVDSFGDKVVFGTFTQIPTTTASTPEYYAVVKSIGSKNSKFESGVHGIIKATAAGTAADGLVTALKCVEQATNANPSFLVGWRDASAFGIDKRSTTHGTSVWRSQIFNINKKFKIKQIRFSTGLAVAANMTITPTIFLDDFSSSSVNNLTVINSTNFAASQRHFRFEPNITGDHNFCLELRFTGTALLPVLLPIEIDFELLENTR